MDPDIVHVGSLPVNRAGMTDLPHRLEVTDQGLAMVTSWTPGSLRAGCAMLVASFLAAAAIVFTVVPQYFVFEPLSLAVFVYGLLVLAVGLAIAKPLSVATGLLPRPMLCLAIDHRGIAVGRSWTPPSYDTRYAWEDVERLRILPRGLRFTASGAPVRVDVLLFRDDLAEVRRIVEIEAPQLR